MATRRDCREWVVQLLFQLDLNPTDDLVAVFERFWEDKKVDRRSRAWTENLVKGVCGRLADIDACIQRIAEHWDLKRMAVVDRNAIRMAVYELMACPDVPPAVSINESVDVVKYFGTLESGRFVNGILDRIRKDLGRSGRKQSAGKGA